MSVNFHPQKEIYFTSVDVNWENVFINDFNETTIV